MKKKKPVCKCVCGVNMGILQKNTTEKSEVKFMFAIVTKDDKGQTIQLFKSKKFAQIFYDKIKDIYISEG